MTTIKAEIAETGLSDLLRRAALGEEIVITSAGVPKARLVPIADPASQGQRQLGGLLGLGTVPAGFDDPLPDNILVLFEGR